uniref:hypothetical protein n=1 Tax=Vibrio sp. TaxID=678 RepID=UPI001F1ADCDE|nr:hypothetical protein [Vibrio sp.]
MFLSADLPLNEERANSSQRDECRLLSTLPPRISLFLTARLPAVQRIDHYRPMFFLTLPADFDGVAPHALGVNLDYWMVKREEIDIAF